MQRAVVGCPDKPFQLQRRHRREAGISRPPGTLDDGIQFKRRRTEYVPDRALRARQRAGRNGMTMVGTRKLHERKHVVRRGNNVRSIAQELVRTTARGQIERTGNGSTSAIECEGCSRRQQGTTSLPRLDDDRHRRERSNQAVALRERPSRGARRRREFTQHKPLASDAALQRSMVSRICDVEAGSDHGSR